jgi:hypothetical protein
MQPVYPWRRLRFVRARQGAGLGDGGTAKADVFLGNSWHVVEFTMDGEGFKKLSAMPERSRMLLLDSLACMPVRSHGLSLTEKRRPRGRNVKSSIILWHTARTLGPALLRWAKQAAEKTNDKPYSVVLKAMKKDGLTNTSPEAVTAYLHNLVNVTYSCLMKDPKAKWEICTREIRWRSS